MPTLSQSANAMQSVGNLVGSVVAALFSGLHDFFDGINVYKGKACPESLTRGPFAQLSTCESIFNQVTACLILFVVLLLTLCCCGLCSQSDKRGGNKARQHVRA